MDFENSCKLERFFPLQMCIRDSIGALCEKQHRALRLDSPFHRLPQLRERQRYIPEVPGRAIGRIGQEHIYAMLWQGAQALNAVGEVQALRDRLLATMTRSGGISDKITFPFSMGAEDAFGDRPGFHQHEAQKHRIACLLYTSSCV